MKLQKKSRMRNNVSPPKNAIKCVLTNCFEGFLPALSEALQIFFDRVSGAELMDDLLSMQLQLLHPVLVSLHGSQLHLVDSMQSGVK